jgi:hypothetical protein
MDKPAERSSSILPHAHLPGTSPQAWSLECVLEARELFWRNVMREILTSLSVACLARRSAHAARADDGEQTPSDEGASPDAQEPDPDGEEAESAPEEAGPREEDDLFDGRLAILTHAGERIPIAEVYPLFACGINISKEDRELAMAVECSVFQIRTPSGEVFTLPLQEMRAFHSVSPELMERLEEEARKRSDHPAEEVEAPFGFAAFTSIARQQRESEES